MKESAEPLRAARFAARVREAARAAGYDVDSPRGGGKTELARRAGMTNSSIGRILAGRTMPDPYCLERLAAAVVVPVDELLELAGVVSPQPRRRLTPREAAAGLGITDPGGVRVFEALVSALLDEQSR